MMVKLRDGAVEAYPYDRAQLCADHRDKSIPRKLTPALLADLGAALVCATDYPVFDPQTEVVTETTPVCINGAYYQHFAVEPK